MRFETLHNVESCIGSPVSGLAFGLVEVLSYTVHTEANATSRPTGQQALPGLHLEMPGGYLYRTSTLLVRRCPDLTSSPYLISHHIDLAYCACRTPLH